MIYSVYLLEIRDLESHYDLTECSTWMKNITAIQNKVNLYIPSLTNNSS